MGGVGGPHSTGTRWVVGGIGKQRWGVFTCLEKRGKSKGEELTGVAGVGAGKNTHWVRCWSGD